VNKKLRLVFFACGATIFAVLVARMGLGTIAANVRHAGWVFIPLLVLTGVMYVCHGAASWLILGGESNRPAFWRVWAITVSGFSINFVTPMVNLGGEPYKAAALAPWLGRRRAAGFVVLYQMMHSLAIALVSLTALALGALLLPADRALRGVMALAAAALVAGVVFLFWAHRHGGLQRMLDLALRLPLVRRLARRLEPYRPTLGLIDEQITAFYHTDRRRFFLALGLEYVGRVLLMSEYYLILLTMGIDVGWARAFVVGGLASLVGNAMFMLPYELGAKEGSLYLLFQLVGVNPGLGVYAALVSRLRDFTWIAIGLVLIWAAGRRPAPAPAASDA
jgi:uncharacterized protein (TIRG00374 family)